MSSRAATGPSSTSTAPSNLTTQWVGCAPSGCSSIPPVREHTPLAPLKILFYAVDHFVPISFYIFSEFESETRVCHRTGRTFIVVNNASVSETHMHHHTGRDRLAHAGDCLIPRPGTAWRHVHRPQFGRLVLGATATTFHDSDWDPTVWLADDVVTITEVATADDRMEVRVHRTDRKVRTDGWRIRVGHNTSSAHGDVADTQGQPDNDTDDDGDVASSRSAGSAVAKPSPSHANSGGDGGRDGLDDDELPWQVLALLSQWSIDECERKLREFDERLREEVAKLEHTLPQSPDVWPMPAESSQSAPQAHFVPPLTPAEATTACLDERVDDVIAELSKQLVSTPPGRTAVLLHTQLAECLRRAGQPAQALEDARASLALAPSFGPALLQHALALLDLGNTTAAIRALESVLGVWPSAPGLDRLLVQAHARARRARVGPVYAEFRVGDRAKTREDVEGFWSEGESVDVIGLGPPTAPISVRLVSTGRVIAVQPDHLERVGETSKTEGAEDSAASNDNGGDDGDDASLSRNHYVVLGLPVDFSAAQLRDAYKRLSRAHHPDREGGSTTVFQAVAEAHALLSDPSRREEYVVPIHPCVKSTLLENADAMLLAIDASLPFKTSNVTEMQMVCESSCFFFFVGVLIRVFVCLHSYALC